jgi:serine/threonine protein kinase
MTWYETSRHVWVITEYCAGDTLAMLLQQDGKLPEKSVRTFARDVALGLQYMHSKGFLFCDVKPSNILLDEYGVLKLADFELAQSFPIKRTLSQIQRAKRGTPFYMAPELFADGAVRSTASDLWSFGCLLYEMIAGRPPFVAENLHDLVHAIVTDTPDLVPDASPAFASLLFGLLQKDPMSRLRWSDIVQQAFWTQDGGRPLPRFVIPPQKIFPGLDDSAPPQQLPDQQQPDQQPQNQQQQNVSAFDFQPASQQVSASHENDTPTRVDLNVDYEESKEPQQQQQQRLQPMDVQHHRATGTKQTTPSAEHVAATMQAKMHHQSAPEQVLSPQSQSRSIQPPIVDVVRLSSNAKRHLLRESSRHSSIDGNDDSTESMHTVSPVQGRHTGIVEYHDATSPNNVVRKSRSSNTGSIVTSRTSSIGSVTDPSDDGYRVVLMSRDTQLDFNDTGTYEAEDEPGDTDNNAIVSGAVHGSPTSNDSSQSALPHEQPQQQPFTLTTSESAATLQAAAHRSPVSASSNGGDSSSFYSSAAQISPSRHRVHAHSSDEDDDDDTGDIAHGRASPDMAPHESPVPRIRVEDASDSCDSSTTISSDHSSTSQHLAAVGSSQSDLSPTCSVSESPRLTARLNSSGSKSSNSDATMTKIPTAAPISPHKEHHLHLAAVPPTSSPFPAGTMDTKLDHPASATGSMHTAASSSTAQPADAISSPLTAYNTPTYGGPNRASLLSPSGSNIVSTPGAHLTAPRILSPHPVGVIRFPPVSSPTSSSNGSAAGSSLSAHDDSVTHPDASGAESRPTSAKEVVLTVGDLLLHPAERGVQPLIGSRIEKITPPQYELKHIPFEIPLSMHEVASDSGDDFFECNLHHASCSEYFDHVVCETLESLSPSESTYVHVLNFLTDICMDQHIANSIVKCRIMPHLVHTLRSKPNHTVLVQALTLCGMLFRYATIVQGRNCMNEIIVLLSDQLRHTNSRVQRRAMAALGELLFYVATQSESEVVNTAISSRHTMEQQWRWHVPASTITLIQRFLTRSPTCEIVTHYALKLIDNITAAGVPHCQWFLSNQVVTKLLGVLTASNPLLRAAAASCLMRMVFEDRRLIGSVFSRLSHISLISGISEGRARPSFLNLLNVALFDKCPKVPRLIQSAGPKLKESLLKLLSHRRLLVRAKAFLSLCLMGGIDRSWIVACFQHNILPAFDRAARANEAAASAAAQAVAANVAPPPPKQFAEYLGHCQQMLLAHVAKWLHTLLDDIRSVLTTLGQRHHAPAAVNRQLKDLAEQCRLILFCTHSGILRTHVIKAFTIESISQICSMCVFVIAPEAGVLKESIFAAVQCMSSYPQLMFEQHHAVVHSLIPSLVELLVRPNESDRFTCLTTATSMLMQFMRHGVPFYSRDAPINVIHNPEGAHASVADVEYGLQTDTINSLIVHQIFACLPQLLDAADPTPSYALKLINEILNANPNLLVYLHEKQLTSTILASVHPQSKHYGEHTIKLVRHIVSAPTLIDAKFLDEHDVTTSIAAALMDAVESGVHDLYVPLLDVVVALLSASSNTDSHEARVKRAQPMLVSVTALQPLAEGNGVAGTDSAVRERARVCLTLLAGLFPQVFDAPLPLDSPLMTHHSSSSSSSSSALDL